MPKLNEFPENLRCTNINGAMHKLLRENRPLTKTFLKLFKASDAISYD